MKRRNVSYTSIILTCFCKPNLTNFYILQVRTLSLIIVTFTYLLVGAAIFDYLEGDNNEKAYNVSAGAIVQRGQIKVTAVKG